jgi:hypothetical protein
VHLKASCRCNTAQAIIEDTNIVITRPHSGPSSTHPAVRQLLEWCAPFGPKSGVAWFAACLQDPGSIGAMAMEEDLLATEMGTAREYELYVLP